MARNSKIVTITAEGRDNGKQFKLTEMPVLKAEKWAARALLALGKAGLSSTDPTAGLAGFASVGLDAIARLDWADAEPLMDEMLSCVQFVSSGGVERNILWDNDDVQEITTLVTLRKEILGLHFDFFGPADPLNLDT